MLTAWELPLSVWINLHPTIVKTIITYNVSVGKFEMPTDSTKTAPQHDEMPCKVMDNHFPDPLKISRKKAKFS